MYLTKDEFFKKNRDLQAKRYYYSYEDQIFIMTSEEVVRGINGRDKEVQRCLYVMEKLNAPDDFILNDYLQGFADEFMEWHIRIEIRDSVEEKVQRGERVPFNLKGEDGEVHEYIAYQDDEGYYHVHSAVQSFETQGWKRFSRFSESLTLYFKEAVFDDFRRVDESEIEE